MTTDEDDRLFLSLLEEVAKKRKDLFAVCTFCGTIFRDDVVVMGSVQCPVCENGAVMRGIPGVQSAKHIALAAYEEP